MLPQHIFGSLGIINSLKTSPCSLGRTLLIFSPQVRTIRERFNKEEADNLGRANDAQQLLERLQREGCWMRFQLDTAGRITRIAWPLDEQRHNALRYHKVIIQDNTFNTNA